MRMHSYILFLILSLIFLLCGCTNNPTEISAKTATSALMEMPSTIPAETVSPYSAPSLSETIIPEETSIPADDEALEQREVFKNMKVEIGEWIYYAGSDKMFSVEDDYECPIKRVKKDGSNDMELGITGFSFQIVDKYIYVCKNHVYGDFGHWDTVRTDLDGSNKKDMPYGDMNIEIFDDRLYFDTWNESVLYAADSSCEQVKKYDIEVPDQKTIKNKLKGIEPVYVLTVNDVKDGWIYFSYNLLDTDGMPFFEGEYKVNLEGTKIEKTNPGTFNETQIGYYN